MTPNVRLSLNYCNTRPAAREVPTTSMLWKLKSLNLRTTPAREGEQTYDTEAAFESAVKDARADPMTRIVSATFPDGTVLDEIELQERPG